VAIYLDHAATSPLRAEVLTAYTDALQVVGNPSSIHSSGQAARELLETGREQVARSLGIPKSVVTKALRRKRQAKSAEKRAG